jgi:hypothetical protein
MGMTIGDLVVNLVMGNDKGLRADIERAGTLALCDPEGVLVTGPGVPMVGASPARPHHAGPGGATNQASHDGPAGPQERSAGWRP